MWVLWIRMTACLITPKNRSCGFMKKKPLVKLFHTATELQRAVLEYRDLKKNWGQIKPQLPAGDGHPVLILPGFFMNDAFTSALRDCARDMGYAAYAMEGGFNLGLNEKTAGILRDRLHKIFKDNGNRKVTIVGHSLGGVFARELAREYPEMVRNVITLGSPFGGLGAGGSIPDILRKVYAALNVGTDHLGNDDLHKRCLTPPPVPATSVYSKTDGVVDWHASLNPMHPMCENIEVGSSHAGMIYNRQALVAIFDRLAQKEGAWQCFDAQRYQTLKFPKGVDAKALPADPCWQPKPGQSRPLFRKK